jgi:hypothetical protein
MMNGEQTMCEFGLRWRRDFLKRVDAARGPYHSRNQFILKILQEHLDAKESTLSGSTLSGKSPSAAVVTEDANPSTGAPELQ